jgi:tyrosine-protein phosphatase SIW14
MKILPSFKQFPVLVMAVLSIPAWAANTSAVEAAGIPNFHQAVGIPNFHQVNEHIYRGGQPDDEAWSNLAHLGVKTVIDLRREGEGDHSTDAEKQAVEAAGMRYLSVPMNGILAPEEEDVAKVLAVLDSNQPVFVHCKEGKDRTGTVIAVYRMGHDGWQSRAALKEAESYGMHWFEVGMKQYIKNYQAPVEQAGGSDLQPATSLP